MTFGIPTLGFDIKVVLNNIGNYITVLVNLLNNLDILIARHFFGSIYKQ